MSGRQKEIADGIADLLKTELTGDFLYDEIHVKDYQEDNPLSRGITVSPLAESEQIGTNERDDIDYVTLVSRSLHALGEDDLEYKSNFRDEVRRIFHRKRLTLFEGCILYSRVSFGNFNVPSAWTQDNNSVTTMQIYTLVRESRE